MRRREGGARSVTGPIDTQAIIGRTLLRLLGKSSEFEPRLVIEGTDRCPERKTTWEKWLGSASLFHNEMGRKRCMPASTVSTLLLEGREGKVEKEEAVPHRWKRLAPHNVAPKLIPTISAARARPK
jgi:hypothetical protein